MIFTSFEQSQAWTYSIFRIRCAELMLRVPAAYANLSRILTG